MQTKTKSSLIILIPCYLIWFLGYEMIIIGNKMGYAAEIIGAVLSYVFLIRLIRLLKSKRFKNIIIVFISLFYLSDIITSLFFLIRIIMS
ncbi:MAG: hypothetical protein K0R54_1599 [Clostridiaceae bacterium]|jgi:hypothetical protein|nr:hypothetical protein [Clostridiaceae bacterium]